MNTTVLICSIVSLIITIIVGKKYYNKKFKEKEFVNNGIRTKLNSISKEIIKNYITAGNDFDYKDSLKNLCDAYSKFYKRNMRITVFIFKRYNKISVDYTFYAIGLGTFSVGYTSDSVEVNETISKNLPGNDDAGHNHLVMEYSSSIY